MNHMSYIQSIKLQIIVLITVFFPCLVHIIFKIFLNFESLCRDFIGGRILFHILEAL